MGLFGGGGLKSAFSLAQLIGQDIVARSISLTQTAGNTAIQLVSGARVNFGGDASDYLASNGTTISTPKAFTATGNITTSNDVSCARVSATVYSVAPTMFAGAAARLLWSSTAPTISSGFGAGASIVANNGSIAFTINTGAASASGVIGLPAATTGWILSCNNMTTFGASQFLTRQTASTTTSATIGNFTSAGASGNWAANDVIAIIAVAY
jgi:hypothetical protein